MSGDFTSDFSSDFATLADGSFIMNPGDLIRLAMLQSGAVDVSKTIYAEEMYAHLSMLDGLMAQWQRRRWLVWSLQDTACISGGQQSYTIGAGGNFNVARPDKIEAAYARLLTSTSQQSITGTTVAGGVIMLPPGSNLPTDPTGLPPGTYWSNGGVLMVTPGAAATSSTLFTDFPLAIIPSREDYSNIILKTLTTFPSAVYYDPAWPTGNLFFWPVPQASQWELHVVTKTTLPDALDLTTDLAVPPEYRQALVYTLAVMLRPYYGAPPDPTLQSQAAGARAALRMANMQMPEAHMPAGLRSGPGSSVAAGSSQGFQTGWTS